MKNTDQLRQEMRDRATSIDIEKVTEQQWKEAIETIQRIFEKNSSKISKVPKETSPST